MAKTLTIHIKSVGEALEGFRKTFSDVAAGRRVKRRKGVSFTSVEAARSLLTPSRLALLHMVRTERPGSILELAKMAHRNVKGIREDLQRLKTYGLIRMAGAPNPGKRRTRVPQVPFDEIKLKIAL